MKKIPFTSLIPLLRYCAGLAFTFLLAIVLFSFKAGNISGGLFSQLGITQPGADEKITNSFLGGYLDAYGAKNVKNIAVGNRAAVTNDLLNYTKKFVSSEAFKKEYLSMKERNKPTENKLQSPEEMRRDMINQYTKSLADAEANAKKADPSIRKFFDDAVVTLRQQLKDAQDPDNKMLANYAKNYDNMLKMHQQSYNQQLQRWESDYPSNQQLFVKKRLKQFLDETRDIDYTAELTERYGKKIFVNPAYEHKSNRWKMAFRAGKEVVEPARAFVEQWLSEIK